MPNEIELKLVLKPEDADRLEVWASRGAVLSKAQQRSIYFDTPDHLLVKSGLSLRIPATFAISRHERLPVRPSIVFVTR